MHTQNHCGFRHFYLFPSFVSIGQLQLLFDYYMKWTKSESTG
ncbi:hypothetical protein NC652_016387 [Populus alba x Populus x berolinensis]|uniref:Uncharacterized protein n=1 Tax=Populus alba x Populus x berolinensis TaxID=444605 RepID=A0AAD6QMP6_9ROSI|nr:hypothetical protein NC652_016387 [Populus alba x Populus x berolinensis]KAJ6993194.1 hypothetical protein NC653_016350 [Populus alba x Populus x berolinensis]